MAFTPMTVAEIFEAFIDTSEKPLPLRLTAFDGSAAGPEDAKVGINVRSRDALNHIVTHLRDDVGFGRAFVTGELELTRVSLGHPIEAFGALMDLHDQFEVPPAATLAKVVRSLRAMGLPYVPEIPEIERTAWWKKRLHNGLARHSKERDAASISSHYDVSNEFYELLLGASMTYTCAYYPNEDSTLEEAQENKYRLVFDKLRLKEGGRLLDVGCGWGGMVLYAARRGVKAIGVTLSEQQAEWAQAKIKEEGLEDLAEVRFQDYRDVSEQNFDAISAIGILEHIGVKNYPSFFGFLYGKLKEGGLMLNHCITYWGNHRTRKGTFIDRYIFPDGELTGVGTIMHAMQDQGFEMVDQQNLRFDYARTLNDWCENLENDWDKAVELVGEQTAKLWGMYMAGSEYNFRHNAIQLHQVLGVKLLPDGSRGDVPERQWWED